MSLLAEIVEEIVGDSDDEVYFTQTQESQETLRRQPESDVPLNFENVKIKEEPIDDTDDPGLC